MRLPPLHAKTACILECKLCGETRFAQIEIKAIHDRPGEMRVDVEVDERDEDIVLRFWATHQRPTARAAR